MGVAWCRSHRVTNGQWTPGFLLVQEGFVARGSRSLSPPAMLSFTFLSLQASVAGQDSDRPLRCDLRYLSHSSSLGGAPESRCCWVDEALYRDGGKVSPTFIHSPTHTISD